MKSTVKKYSHRVKRRAAPFISGCRHFISDRIPEEALPMNRFTRTCIAAALVAVQAVPVVRAAEGSAVEIKAEDLAALKK